LEIIKNKSNKNIIYHVGRFFACEKCREIVDRRKKSEHKCHIDIK